MKHILFAQEQAQYSVAILIKDSHFMQSQLEDYYVNPICHKGIPKENVIAFNLSYDRKKVSNQHTKEYLQKLLPVLQKLGIKYIYCADAEYFKTLTRQRKADNQFGYLVDCAIPTFEYIQVVLGMNYGSLLYNPNQSTKLDLSLDTLVSAFAGNYQEIGKTIIHHEDYPKSITQIEWFLNHLHHYPSIVCDIETFSLDLFEAKLGTIAFAWNKHEGGAFCIDYTECVDGDTPTKQYGIYQRNQAVRKLLREFFVKYRGNIKYHNCTYDIKVLILNLFMQHEQDYQGMLYGLEVMTRLIDDTKVIAYLALNTTADLSLGLKDLSHEYAGNYAQEDIKDICLIPRDDLLRYNLTDCLSTWFVYDKYYPQMLRDNQQNIYETLMKPSLKILIQMELVGMPIDLNRVNEVEAELNTQLKEHLSVLQHSQTVLKCQSRLQQQELKNINSKLINKQYGIERVADYLFNPNSTKHLTELLYTEMGLPVLDFTATKQPATGAATLKKLTHHTTNQEYLDILKALRGLSSVEKILSSFIPAFKKAKTKRLGSWLHGSFNLNGTVSGRLSSSKPNLTNIPSGSVYGKLIKTCFKAEKGWVFAGADFSSLITRRAA